MFRYKALLVWLMLLPFVACQSDKADAVRDLFVDRIFWKAGPDSASDKAPVNIHRFTVTNTSSRYAYSQIEVRFDYYDRTHHKIDSAKHTITRTIDPRAAITIGELHMGPAKPETTSATVTVLTAQVM